MSLTSTSLLFEMVASAPGGGTEGLYIAGGSRALYEETATAGQAAFIKKYISFNNVEKKIIR